MPTQKVWCPYCLQTEKVQIKRGEPTISQCGEELSRDYLEAVRDKPPVVLVTIGMSGHGKTTYVESLSIVLEKLAKVVPGARVDYLDTNTSLDIQSIRTRSTQGELNRPTVNRPGQTIFKPLLLDVANFMGRTHNPVAIYDVSGEAFAMDNRDVLDKAAPPLKQASVIWFLVSVRDLRRNVEGQSIVDLINVYRRAMEQLQASEKGRHLLVYYTKADEVAAELPPRVQQYIMNDPYKHIETQRPDELAAYRLDPIAYTNAMKGLSNDLELYTVDQINDGQLFINMARQRGLSLSFAITSSIGQQAMEPGQTQRRPPRYRVLDGLIWAMVNDQPKVVVQRAEASDAQVALIIGGGKGNQVLFNENVAEDVADELAAQANVTTYITGLPLPIRKPQDEEPLRAPRKDYALTIGPIVDHLPPETWVFLVTNRPVHDLNDYMTLAWRERIFLMTMHPDENVFLWPASQRVLYNPSEMTIDSVVETFMTMVNNRY